MKPENVNPTNFKREHIIYEDDYFSIAYGVWDDDENGLGMRWNGEDNKNGYPNNRNGQPVWFRISGNLTDIFLAALLSTPYSNKKNIISILNS
jgi:hypothetical protein